MVDDYSGRYDNKCRGNGGCYGSGDGDNGSGGSCNSGNSGSASVGGGSADGGDGDGDAGGVRDSCVNCKYIEKYHKTSAGLDEDICWEKK